MRAAANAGARTLGKHDISASPINIVFEENFKDVAVLMLCGKSRLALQTTAEICTMDTPESRTCDTFPTVAKATLSEQVPDTATTYCTRT
jgi:hypothetical protein